MSLIVTQSSVLLQSSDSNWYYRYFSQEDSGLVTIKGDTTPTTPPSGATPYALLKLGAAYYRWTLTAVGGEQVDVFTASVADGSELDRIVLLLNTLNYAITVINEEGVILASIDQTSYPLTAGLYSLGEGGGCSHGVPCGRMPTYPAQGTYPGPWVRFENFPYHTMP